jgi:hypothetical protein
MTDPETPLILASCHWCWTRGEMGTYLETVRSAGLDRRRCIDRESCRARATATHEYLEQMRSFTP